MATKRISTVMSELEQRALTRRAFLSRVGVVMGFLLLPFRGWIGSNHSPRATVLRMQPVAGVRYSRAARNHMRHRIFPSRDAIIAELPHRGLIFDVEELPVSLSQPELEALFDGHRSLDSRRHADRHAYTTISGAVGKSTAMKSSG